VKNNQKMILTKNISLRLMNKKVNISVQELKIFINKFKTLRQCNHFQIQIYNLKFKIKKSLTQKSSLMKIKNKFKNKIRNIKMQILRWYPPKTLAIWSYLIQNQSLWMILRIRHYNKVSKISSHLDYFKLSLLKILLYNSMRIHNRNWNQMA
jgi:hypothetical protein